jgi:hypothetical protein
LPRALMELIAQGHGPVRQPVVSGVLRALASASKAPHRSRSWWSSAFTWSKAPYLSRARR